VTVRSSSSASAALVAANREMIDRLSQRLDEVGELNGAEVMRSCSKGGDETFSQVPSRRLEAFELTWWLMKENTEATRAIRYGAGCFGTQNLAKLVTMACRINRAIRIYDAGCQAASVATNNCSDQGCD
jgi:hypothetical protein